MDEKGKQYDILGLEGEEISGTDLLETVMLNGKSVIKPPDLKKVREYSLNQVSQLPKSLHSISENVPYTVQISKDLQKLTNKLKNRELK